MAINSLNFIIFVAIVCLLYFVVPKKIKWVVLLIANYVFYWLCSKKLIVYMLVTTISIYLLALWMGKIDSKTKELCKKIRYEKVDFNEPIPKEKGISLDTVKYAASRIDPEVKFTDEACSKLVKVPRVFLNTVLKGCVAWAKENNVTLITEKEMEIIQDKRNKEKK